MIAQIITYSGSQYGLLAATPNWETEVKITLELPTDVEKQPITFQESRRNFAASARYTMEWSSYLSSAAQSTELRIFLTRIREEPILAPLWPDVCEIQTAVSIGATTIPLVDLPVRYGTAWIIAKEDFSTWEIVSVTSLTSAATLSSGTVHAWTAGDLMYPLIRGRLEERPQAEAISDETFEVPFKLKEDSQFAWRVSPAGGTLRLVGSSITAFASTPMWDFAPNWARPTDWTEMPDVVYQHVGFLREDQQRAYDHRNARGQELEFYDNTRDVTARIEFFWRSMRGTTRRFMIPTYKGDLRIAQNTPVSGNPTWIVCELSEFGDPGREAQPGDPFVAFIAADNSVDPYEISTITQSTATTLVLTTPAAAHTFNDTILSNLLLARFQDPTLQWSYTTPYMATARIKFVELSDEYPPYDTTPQLPEPAYLFVFNEVGVRVDTFTSYENTITLPSGPLAGTYAPAPFSFATVKTGLKLDQEKIEIQSWKFDGNPLNKMWPFALDGILQVIILEVDANTPAAATTITRFFGDIWSIDSQYKATAVPFGNFFDRKFPRFLLQVSDNYTQFSPPTNIAASSFSVAGTIHDPNVPGTPLQTLIVTSTAARTNITAGLAYTTAQGGPDDYYAGGWLETGTGVNIEKRGILASSNGSGSDVVLTIDRPLIKAANGQAITLYAGYDGGIDRCDVKFANRINFGGHAYIPNVSPAVKALKPQDTQGGKKRG